MALKSTIFKAELNVADMDRDVYADFSLTIARHPSETDERMMLRVLAFALNASERLEFGRGISTENEPDLWRKSLSGEIELWIELGTPVESRLRKACGRSASVILYSYGGRSVPIWWEKINRDLQRFDNLQIFRIDDESIRQLAEMAAANMQLQCTIQDGEAMLTASLGANHVGSANSLQIAPERLL
ncbi:MAG: YaeQ family protein [Gammaproteobacteria bacterium]|nr:YaeQ family protein [Gammaproteobacteria bacterium]